jgi:hypothetical protein
MPVAGDLITNVVASFVFEGIKRCYGAAKTTIRRRQTINRALDGHFDLRSEAAASAIADLEMVIGADRGQLTELVAAFLRELEASAIPDTIVRTILSSEDTDQIFTAFDLVYRSFAPALNFDCRSFYNALVAAIRERAEARVKDPGLLEFVQAHNKALSNQLKDVIRSLQLAGESKDEIPHQVLADARLKIARAVENANRFVSVETLQGVKRCNIRQLVVPPRLNVLERHSVAITTGGSEILYSNFRSSFGSAVILGDPGGGKSTLTQLLCHDLAYSIGVDSSHHGRRDIGSIKLPLRIVLRSYDKRRQQNPAYGIMDYVVDECSLALESDKLATSRILTRLLALGSIALIFDGLDEILNVEPRREIVTFIEQFADVYAACPVLVTSRFVGYRDAPMSDEFSLFALTRFDTAEIETFAQRMIEQVGALKLTEAKTKASSFIRQTDTVGQDLRENPLMLGLMVYIFMYRGDVPSNRPEIYKECATLMFEKWDQRRDIIFEIPTDFDLLDVFAYLASQIFGSAETEDGVSRDWLIAALRAFFEQWYLEKPKALKVARSLVTFITGRAWVMCEVGPKVFKFTHRTFLEYFFARHLISTSESVTDLIKTKLLDRLIRSEWDVIVHLALHTVVFRDVGKMNQAADTLLSILKSVTLPPPQELAFISFVARALEYLVLPEPKYQDLVRSVSSTAIRIGASATVAAAEAIDILISSSQKRESLVKPVIYSLLRDELKRSFSPERSFAVYVCSTRGGIRPTFHWRMMHRGEYVQVLAQRSTTEGNSSIASAYFTDLNAVMEPTNYGRAVKNVHEARLYISLYRRKYFELVRRHGIGSLIGNGPHLVFANLNDLLLDIIEDIAEEMLLQAEQNTRRLDDCINVVDFLVDNCETPFEQIITGGPVVIDRIENIIIYIYHTFCEARRRKPNSYDWGKVLLALAIYLDIVSPEPRDFKRSPKVQKQENRLEEFMPHTPMQKLMEGLRSSSVFTKLEAWNRRELRFAT